MGAPKAPEFFFFADGGKVFSYPMSDTEEHSEANQGTNGYAWGYLPRACPVYKVWALTAPMYTETRLSSLPLINPSLL